jgi:MFS transporter, SP family, arabinose:H+ symporter
MNRQLSVTAFAGSCCGLLFGYDIGTISSTTLELRTHFALSASALGIAISSALFGTIAGSIAAGFVADAIDRRQALLVSAFLYMFSSLGAAFAPGFLPFAISRFACGIAIGLISVIAPMYLAEVAPAHLRGRLVGGFQINVGIGVVLAFTAGYVIARYSHPDVAWRCSLASGVIPALLCEGLLWRASPSPRWLALKRRFAEAHSVLAALGSTDPDADQASLIASIEGFGVMRSPALFSRRYTRPILLATGIAIFNQLTGVNIFLYYILDVFAELGSGRLNGHKDAVLVSSLSLVVTAIAVSLIDKAGRKPLLLTGAVGMGLCLALLPAIRYWHWPVSSVIVVLVLYNAFFSFSQGAVVWVYLSEIFPLAVRARGQSFGSTVHWVANALIIASFPTIAISLGSKVFVVLAVIMAIQFFVILLLYPETKHVGLESLASDISHFAGTQGNGKTGPKRGERLEIDSEKPYRNIG